MKKKVSIVIAIYNEEGVVDALLDRLEAATSTLAYDFEFLFVNDGSTDDTLGKLTARAAKNDRIIMLDLARNFGHHPALSAGIDHATGDAVLLMDADLEDHPEDIPRFLEAWEEGYEVVYAQRGRRRVNLLKRMAFAVYHWINSRLEQHMPMAGIFSLMDRCVIDVLRAMPERTRYIPGLRAWAGFRQKGILLDRGVRYDDEPRISLFRLLRLALDSYVAFSKLPLKLASMLGLIFSLIGFFAIVFVVGYQLVRGFAVSGWASMISIVIFASGIQLVCLGILGEYMAQILDETKGRPIYLLRKKFGATHREE